MFKTKIHLPITASFACSPPQSFSTSWGGDHHPLMAASLELPRSCPATHRSSHATSLADPFWICQDWHSSGTPAHSSLNGFEEENVEWSLYYQPKQCTIIREIPENRHKFLLFDSPSMGNLMTPISSHRADTKHVFTYIIRVNQTHM